MSSGNQQESFLTVAEVAEILKINQQTVRNWIDAGSMPAVKIGRRVRIKQADLDQIVEDGYAPGSLRGGARAAGPSAQDFWSGAAVGAAEPDPTVVASATVPALEDAPSEVELAKDAPTQDGPEEVEPPKPSRPKPERQVPEKRSRARHAPAKDAPAKDAAAKDAAARDAPARDATAKDAPGRHEPHRLRHVRPTRPPRA